VKGAAVTVSRDEVFEILRGVVPRLEEALPGWSVRPNITGTGAVGLYLDGPAIYRDGEPLTGVNAEGEPAVRHLWGTSHARCSGARGCGCGCACGRRVDAPPGPDRPEHAPTPI